MARSRKPVPEQIADQLQDALNAYSFSHPETDWGEMLEAIGLLADLVEDNRDGYYD